MTTEYKFSKAADLFPLMSEDEIKDLANDILRNGQLEPIILDHATHEIIDGRNRYLACKIVCIDPQIKYYTQKNGSDVIDYVVSLNLKRRHLNETQKGVLVVKIATMRQGDNQHSSCELTTQKQAAEQVGVSIATAKRAKRAIEKCSENVIESMQSGNLTANNAEKLADIPKAEYENIEKITDDEAKKVVKDYNRKKNTEHIKKKTPSLKTNKKYNVIYADPPWKFNFVIESRAVENHYPTMTTDEMKLLPIKNLIADDCILFMWTVSPKIDEAVDLLREWGFTYKSCAVWVKDKIGLGFYFRHRHEILFVATRGDIPTPKESDRFDSVIESPRGKHSEKPEIVYEMIEKMYPEYDKIELFARQKRDGWACWGNEV